LRDPTQSKKTTQLKLESGDTGQKKPHLGFLTADP
jgi:hypothetical protein